MKELIITIGLLLAVASWGLAQEAVHQSPVEAYFAVGPVLSNSRTVFTPACSILLPFNQIPPPYCFTTEHGGSNIAFGGEARVNQGLSAGIELAYAGPDWNIGKNGLGVGSANATYHFGNRKHPPNWEPFVTGGYSLYFGERTDFQSGFNFGGGVNFWGTKHAALRLEVRDQAHINYFGNPGFTHFVAFRVGVTFR